MVADLPGNIPSFSYLEDKAFRHGDIEDIISTLAKASGGGFLGRSTKFTGLDVKRIYFVSPSCPQVFYHSRADLSRGTGLAIM